MNAPLPLSHMVWYLIESCLAYHRHASIHSYGWRGHKRDNSGVDVYWRVLECLGHCRRGWKAEVLWVFELKLKSFKTLHSYISLNLQLQPFPLRSNLLLDLHGWHDNNLDIEERHQPVLHSKIFGSAKHQVCQKVCRYIRVGVEHHQIDFNVSVIDLVAGRLGNHCL